MTDRKEICPACVHFLANPNEPTRQPGSCRRFPPVVLVVPNVAVNLANQQQVFADVKGSAWPFVPLNGWCGEWKALASPLLMNS